MKKIFTLCCLLFLVSPVFAADWMQIAPKIYFDYETLTRNNDGSVTVWYKSLNPGSWKPLYNKKIWFVIDKMNFKCGQRKVQFLHSVVYDLNGQIIENSDLTSEYEEIIPDTNGELKYMAVCMDANLLETIVTQAKYYKTNNLNETMKKMLKENP